MASSTAPAVPCDSPIVPFRYRVRQPGAAAAGCDVCCDDGGVVVVVAGADWLGAAVIVTVFVGRLAGVPVPHAASVRPDTARRTTAGNVRLIMAPPRARRWC